MAKWLGACLGTFIGLAGLALASVALQTSLEDDPWYLETLSVVLVLSALAMFIVFAAGLFLFVGLWVWRYFHTVELLGERWYCRYWPYQGIAQVSGGKLRIGDWSGTVEVTCRARFLHDPDSSNEASFSALVQGGPVQVIEFKQVPVQFVKHPKEGDPASITIKAKPKWWRGRATEQAKETIVGITDHTPGDRTG